MRFAPPSKQASRCHGLSGNLELHSLRCEKRWLGTKRRGDAGRFSIWRSGPFERSPTHCHCQDFGRDRLSSIGSRVGIVSDWSKYSRGSFTFPAAFLLISYSTVSAAQKGQNDDMSNL